MSSMRFAEKVVIVLLGIVLLAGSALSFTRVLPESGRIIGLGIGLIGLSFVAKKLLREEEGSSR
jgi:hypothetical protein